MQRITNKHLPKLIIILIIIFGSSGCFSFKENTIDFSIQDPMPGKEKKNLHAWIKIINLPDYNHDAPKESINAFVTYKLYKFIRELNQFESVNILYSKETKLPANSIILEFQFSKLEEKDKFHAMYFPLGILGMAVGRYATNTNYGFLLYTAFGGPDSVHKIDYSGNLIIYDQASKEKAKIPLNFQSEFSSNMLYYDKARETNLKRSELFSTSIQKALNLWEGK